MDAVFRDQVVTPVCDHPDTDFTGDVHVLFGVPFPVVRKDVIRQGRADFSTGYEHPAYGRLTAEQKVLLYTFINFKKHFYACRRAYETYHSELAQLWGTERPVVIDLGCGPGTAGLALCDESRGAAWEYVGIDSAAPMLGQVGRMFDSAKQFGLYPAAGQVRLLGSWNECGPDGIPRQSPVLVLCSYLFASPSLTVPVLRDMAGWLQSIQRIAERPVMLLAYLNSTHDVANVRYDHFKHLLGLDPSVHQPSRDTVRYRKKRTSSNVDSEEFCHELLVLKEG